MAYEDYSNNNGEHYYDGEPHSFNNVWLGLIAFFLLPIVVLVVAALWSHSIHFTTVSALLRFLWNCHAPIFTQFFVLSLLPNISLAYFIYKQERWKLARGFWIATLAYIILFFLRDF